MSNCIVKAPERIEDTENEKELFAASGIQSMNLLNENLKQFCERLQDTCLDAVVIGNEHVRALCARREQSGTSMSRSALPFKGLKLIISSLLDHARNELKTTLVHF